MEAIASKKSVHYFGSLIFLSLLIVTGLAILYFFITQLITHKHIKAIGFLIFLDIFFIVLSLYFIVNQIKSTHNLRITKNFISVKGIDYHIADIISISFTGKIKHSALGKLEGMQVTFKGNRVLYVYDQYYSNIAEIKQYLDTTWKRDEATKQHFATARFTHSIQDAEDDFNYYKGSLINLNLIIILFFIGFITYLRLSIPYRENIEYTYLLPLSMAVLFSNRFYYFGVGKHFLIVKSFPYPWVKKAYLLNEIREILFESNGKAPHSMTITMQDYTKKKYYASSLYDKHWHALKHDVESKGITVRDELGLG